MILLDVANKISDTPQGGVSWSWVYVVIVSAAGALIFALYKCVAYIITTYLATNEYREKANNDRHEELKTTFTQMKDDRKKEMEGVIDLIKEVRVIATDAHTKIDDLKRFYEK